MGWALIVFIIIFLTIGIGMVALVKGSGKRYIICGKSLPFFLIGTMLMAQAVDANGSIGAAVNSYVGGFWTGFMFPFGVVMCLALTALFYAKRLNQMNLLTLPDFYFRRFDSRVELIVSILTSISFVILVAGNFSGCAWILTVVFNMDYLPALVIISLLIFAYTICGGLFSCAATDIVQMYPAFIGFVGCPIYLWLHYGWGYFAEAIPPDFINMSGLTSMENGALLNWSALVAIGVGAVLSLDFMERIFAARSPRSAVWGCWYAAAFIMVIGTACTLMGLMGLKLYPDLAQTGEFRQIMPLMAMNNVPFILGLLVMGGVIGAGASTANGGILGVSTVMGRNILQKNILRWWRNFKGQELVVGRTEEDRRRHDKVLLLISRCMAFPVLGLALWLAYVRPDPGILMALAFDVVLAGCFVPLTLGLHWKKSNTPGALAAVIVGSSFRIMMHFITPPEWAGIETIISPIVSLLVMVPVSLLTQKSHPPKHHVLYEVPDDSDVLAGVC